MCRKQGWKSEEGRDSAPMNRRKWWWEKETARKVSRNVLCWRQQEQEKH
jgi:hypothetical protein